MPDPEMEMGKKADEMMKQRLLAERDRLLRQREALENQIAGLERAISLFDREDVDPPQAQSSHVRGKVKSLVLDLLREVGTTGLNAQTATDLADRRGVSLGRDSVSSLLSRLKKDGVVSYDGDRYRLMEFSRQDAPRFAVVN